MAMKAMNDEQGEFFIPTPEFPRYLVDMCM